MKCEMTLCVYQEKGECILDGIEINALGMCDACILVDVDETCLAEKKAEMLENLAKRHEATC